MIDFLQSLLGDEFLSKAFILSIFTGIMLQLKGIPKLIWKRIRRLVVFSADIEQTDKLFDYIEKWLKDNYSEKYRNVLANVDYRNFALDEVDNNGQITERPNESNNKTHNNDEEVHYRHNQDVVYIKYSGIIIRISKGREKLEHAKTIKNLFFDNYNISTFFFKKKILRLLDDIVEYNKQFKKDSDLITIYGLIYYDTWNELKDIRPKNIDDVILDGNTKSELLDDVTRFINNKDWYHKRMIPYKRGYLFYGPPGNGKTTLALSLAQYLHKDIYALSISEVQTDAALRILFKNIGSNSILLIEDVDATFRDRNNTDVNGVTFSTFLNCMDGIYSRDGIITIMTTNHIDKLDPALIRDGRIDMRIKFDNPQSQQVKDYIELFYDIKLNGELYNNTHSMAKIQNMCLNTPEDELKETLFESSKTFHN